MVDEAVARTADNRRMTLAIALNYGGRTELVKAAQGLARRPAAGEIAPEEIDEDMIDASLDNPGLPPLALHIPHYVHHRISHFPHSQVPFTAPLLVPHPPPGIPTRRQH